MNTQKRIYYIFSFLILISFKVYSQTYSWYWQNPRPQGNPLFKITAFDTSKAVAVGTVGTIMSTSDGGFSWQVTHKLGGSDYWLWSTHYYNPSLGWAVGGNGNIFKTENGGFSWIKQYSGITSTLQSVFFVDLFNGWAVGWNGAILKTTNSGETWFAQDSKTQADLYSVYFLNKDTGFCVGIRGTVETALVGEFLKTTNGGETWQQVKLGIDNRLWGITFQHGVGWIYGWGGLLLKSTDRGGSWSPKNPSLTESIYSVSFPTENIGYAAGEGGLLLKTTNKGETWFQLKRVTEDTIYSISFVNERIGWFVGENGIIYKTRDGGNSWAQQSSGLTKWITSTDFIGTTGWAVGEKGTIIKTTDNGVTWKNYSTRNNLYNEVKFPNLSIGFIAGNGLVLKSTDGGETWRDVSPSNDNYSSVHFIDGYTGYVCGNNKFYKTTNGGFTWNRIIISNNDSYSKVYFLNQNIGWVVGKNGSIYKTTNGGSTWIKQNTPTTKTILFIKFINERLGWASGEDGLIIKTTNGGNSWTSGSSSFGDEISKIYINDSLNLWAVGKWGSLFKSIDGGNNWSKIQSVTSNFLSTLFFPDVSNGLVFGKGGTILRFREGVQKPVIGITSARLTFNAFKNGNIPPNQSVIIFNSEGGTLNWTATKNASWLDVSPSSGTNTTNIIFSINTTNLSVGTYYDSVSISDPNALNSPQKIYITYNVYEPGKQPEIDLGGITSLLFEADQNGPLPPKQTFMIRNSGGSILEWNADIDVDWLNTSIQSGSLGENQFIIDSVGVNRTDLVEGTYKGKITINSFGAFNSPQIIDVTYKIYSAPKFVLSDTVITFYTTSYGPIPENQIITITNSGRSSFNWIGTKDKEWFDFNPKVGKDNQFITIEIKNTNFSIGEQIGYITLTSSEAINSPIKIKVILKILPEALISVPYDSIVFYKTEIGEFRDTTISIINIGTSNLEISSHTFTGEYSSSFEILNNDQITILPGEKKDLHFRFKPLKIGRKYSELNISSNAFSINNGKIILPFIGYGIDTKPPEITGIIPQIAVYGDSIKISSLNAQDLSGIKKFELWYRSSNEDWSPLRKRDITSNQNGYQFIPSSSVKQYGVDFRITAEDSAGNIGILLNKTNPQKPITFFSIPIKIPKKDLIGSTFSTPGGTTKAYYRMFSSPIVFDSITAKDFWGHLGDYRYQWRFRVPINGLDNWIDGENEVIKSGISYFIITRNPSTVSGNSGTTVKFENIYRDGIQLQKGFNFIGNPFAFEIPNNKINFTDKNQSFQNNAWYYAGNYQWVLYEPFKVWGGYCIYAENPTKMVVEETIKNTTILKNSSSIDGWELQIIVNDGELFDVSNYIGMKSKASNKYDINDFHEPPRFDGGLSLFFPHNDWDAYSGNYAGDFREISNGNKWDFTILSEKDRVINIEFKPSEYFPNNFIIQLFDKDNLRYIPINNYKAKIHSSDGVRNFSLFIGTQEFQSENENKIDFTPNEYKLYQNYPNPFNSKTKIIYHLPEEGLVRLEVYSILGSKVKTVINEYQQKGIYEIIFDAKDLASGVYFYRLNIEGKSNYSFIRKMIYMK